MLSLVKTWWRQVTGIARLESRLDAMQAAQQVNTRLAEESIARLSQQLQAQMSLGVDLAPHEQSQIVLLSRLGGGQVRIISTHFKHLHHLEEAVKRLQAEFGIRDEFVLRDMPRGMRPYHRQAFLE